MLGIREWSLVRGSGSACHQAAAPVPLVFAKLPQAVGLCVAHGLDPASPPRGRLPRLGDVDGLPNDLAVVELHDPDNVPWSAVVSDCVLVNPEVAGADRPSYLEVE